LRGGEDGEDGIAIDGVLHPSCRLEPAVVIIDVGDLEFKITFVAVGVVGPVYRRHASRSITVVRVHDVVVTCLDAFFEALRRVRGQVIAEEGDVAVDFILLAIGGRVRRSAICWTRGGAAPEDQGHNLGDGRCIKEDAAGLRDEKKAQPTGRAKQLETRDWWEIQEERGGSRWRNLCHVDGAQGREEGRGRSGPVLPEAHSSL
jgi:hypothetical protein